MMFSRTERSPTVSYTHLDYTIYLDSYGYMIYVEENDEIGDYALLMDTQDKSNFSGNRALLVFADGTEKVVDTTENYTDNSDDYIPNGSIVTYRADEDGDYTPKAVDATQSTGTQNDPNQDAVDGFKLTNDKAGIATDTSDSNSEANAVSYTHLDVYKRQVEDRAKNLSNICWTRPPRYRSNMEPEASAHRTV